MILTLGLCIGTLAYSQGSAKSIEKEMSTHKDLKPFVIEREMPDVQNLTSEDLKAASQNSNQVLKDLGPKIVWLHSYVAEDKIFCVYQAENKELVKKHAETAGFPANSIREVAAVISPATAN